METIKKAPRLRDEEDKGKETLEANLWGQLQEHIPLQSIYEKLLQRDLFRLRIVSKEWNHAALQWILPKPSFVTIAPLVFFGRRCFLNGIVMYNSASGKFKFDRQLLRLGGVETHVPSFEVEGLILCHNPDDLVEWGVFNVHNQTWHAIPAGPKRSKTTLSACGLVVDTTVRPYTFKLIEGNRHFNTQIYDSKSRSWRRTSSRLPSSTRKFLWNTYVYSCICNNDNVYISQDTNMIWKYSVEDDKWTRVKSPTMSLDLLHPSRENTLGIWEGRIFTTRVMSTEQRVTVWELVDSEGQEWVEYARMPKELSEWFWKFDYDNYDNYGGDEVGLRSFFRDGYMLVCSWRFLSGYAYVLALFDIATKIWQEVDLPRGTVAVHEHELSELESSNEGKDVDFDEVGDNDEVDDYDEG